MSGNLRPLRALSLLRPRRVEARSNDLQTHRAAEVGNARAGNGYLKRRRLSFINTPQAFGETGGVCHDRTSE